MSDSARPAARSRLGSPELRRLIEGVVRKRVPESDVDDLVQTVLCEALAAEGAPDDEVELRRWIVGVARHKVADYHRRGARERPVELPEHLAGSGDGHEARELAHWAERQTDGSAEAQRTLDWMAREGGGEKLAHIAAEEALPPEQVRQRVSRLRRVLRQRWLAELAAVAAVGAIALLFWRFWRREDPIVTPVPDTPVSVERPNEDVERGRIVRAEALRACSYAADAADWRRCVDGLDRARKLDPAGDDAPEVGAARARAKAALAPPPAPPVQLSATPEQKENAPPTPTSAPAPSSTPPAPDKVPPRIEQNSTPSEPPLPKQTTTKPSKKGGGKRAPSSDSDLFK